LSCQTTTTTTQTIARTKGIAGLLAKQGISASADALRALPYIVEFGPQLEERLANLQADRGYMPFPAAAGPRPSRSPLASRALVVP
jgi:hypothetical protein